MPTAAAIAERYSRIFPEQQEEFKSSAYWGAVRAARSYSPRKRVPGLWKRWLRTCVKGSVRDVLRSSWVQRFEPVAQEDLELIEDHRAQSAEAKAECTFDGLMTYLTPRQRELCSLVYRGGLKPSEAGRVMGLSRFRGCEIHQEAIETLREVLSVA